MLQVTENCLEALGLIVALAFAYMLVFGGRLSWFVRVGERSFFVLRFNSATTELKKIYRLLTSREA